VSFVEPRGERIAREGSFRFDRTRGDEIRIAGEEPHGETREYHHTYIRKAREQGLK
jgi:hypothetical protein